MRWTNIHIATRRVASSGNTKVVPVEEPGFVILAGIQADPRTQRASPDLTGLEPRPEIAVVTVPDPPQVGEMEPISVSLSEPAYVSIDGERIGVQAAGETLVRFMSAGSYRVRFTPADRSSTSLPAVVTLSVTPGGTEAPADITVGESPQSLKDDIASRVEGLQTLIDRASTAESSADALTIVTVTNAQEAEQAIRQLATIVREGSKDRGDLLRGLRRVLGALRELIVRRV